MSNSLDKDQAYQEVIYEYSVASRLRLCTLCSSQMLPAVQGCAKQDITAPLRASMNGMYSFERKSRAGGLNCSKGLLTKALSTGQAEASSSLRTW